jgi:serine phosphatase RsbU (regulator of sigma subunit)
LFQQQEELVMLNENLEVQKREVEITYTKLKETSETLGKSIAYASHIQSIILADTKRLQAFFSDLFIIYRPQDVVSGDFYWFSQLNDQEAIFVLADCTGHGVPGAFMSMLGSTLLHETINVKGISNDPARILKNLHAALRKILKQDESRNTDGMDISLCYFEKQATRTKISFAGAKTAMYYVENQQFMTIQGDRIYLGCKNPSVEFQNKEALVAPNSIFYFTSDGFGDQNNAARVRFGVKPLQEKLLSISHLPLSTQKQALETALDQEQEAQRDDISLVGLLV